MLYLSSWDCLSLYDDIIMSLSIWSWCYLALVQTPFALPVSRSDVDEFLLG